MSYKPNTLNKKGQQIMEAYREYHNPATSQLNKEAMLAYVSANLGGKKLTWIDFFKNPDTSVWEAFLSKKPTLQPDEDSLLPEIESYVTGILSDANVHHYDIGFLRNRRNSQKIFYVERRIGLKASFLAELIHADIGKVHEFFDHGHAEAVVKMMLHPAVEYLLSDYAKKEGLSIQYEFEKTRKYCYNLKVRFLLKYPNEITDKKIHQIGECLLLLDKYRTEGIMYF